MKALNLRFAKVPKKNSISFDLVNSIPDKEKNPTLIAKKLFDAIEKCKSPIKSINRVTDLDTQLSKAINLFTGGIRGEYLRAAYSYLGTILPTNVDCERSFSTAAYVDHKNRTKVIR